MCATPAEVCCLGANGMEGCQPAGTPCNGLSQACDETTDCPAGDICCLDVMSPSVTGVQVQCAAACTGGLFSVQLCRSDTECASGQCIPQNCMLGGGSLSVEACSMIPTCMPAM